MAYNIGQLKRPQISNYLTSIEHNDLPEYRTKTSELTNINFEDFSLQVKNGALSVTENYYLRFSVKKRDLVSAGESAEQNFSLYLRFMSDSKVETQLIKSFYCGESSSVDTEERVVYEVVFKPNTSYDEIAFVLHRTVEDYTTHNENGTSGRLIDVDVERFAIVNNVIESLPSEVSKLQKIGVQGPTGMIMAINGEEIRVGRTELYEMYSDDIEVTYMGFVVEEASTVTEADKDRNGKIVSYSHEIVRDPFFIMDYKY